MVHIQSIKVNKTPLFSLVPLNPLPFFAVSGGGGSSKSGIQNEVRLISREWTDPKVDDTVAKIETGEGICTSLTSLPLSPTSVLLFCVVGSTLLGYNLTMSSEELKIHVTKVVEVFIKGQGGEDIGCVECIGCEKVETGGVVKIGTEKGYLLSYVVDVKLGGIEKVRVTLGRMTRPHDNISSVFVGRGLTVTGGKDGKVGFHIQGGKVVFKQVVIPPPPPLPRQNDRQKLLDAQVAVRGCGVGEDGRVYTLASSRRGKTWLFVWLFEGSTVSQIGDKLAVNDEYPSTGMAVVGGEGGGDVLAIGGVDGTVRTYFVDGPGRAAALTGDVKNPTKGMGMFGGEKNFVQAHDLPITAIGDGRGGSGTVDVVTVSADGRVARIKVLGREEGKGGGGCGWITWIMLVLFILMGVWAAVMAEGFCKGVYDKECVKLVAGKLLKGEGGEVIKLVLRKEL